MRGTPVQWRAVLLLHFRKKNLLADDDYPLGRFGLAGTSFQERISLSNGHEQVTLKQKKIGVFHFKKIKHIKKTKPNHIFLVTIMASLLQHIFYCIIYEIIINK